MSESTSFVTAGAPHNAALQVVHVEKVFGSKGAVTKALNGIDLTVEKGEFIAVMGPSGSGKSTLLNCIATIERVTAGSIQVNGICVNRLKGKALASFRRDNLGFIFQDANLLDTLNGYENIALALSIKGERPAAVDGKVKAIASSLGIEEVLDKMPAAMSGGQRQRVAAARAMVTEPQLILADEPTGALDSRNATIMLNTLEAMNSQMGATIVMVTHDAYAASFASRVVFIKDGKVFSQVYRTDAGRRDLFDRIMDVTSFLGGEVRDDA